MTKFHVKTNSSSYLRDKEIFIKELRHFHDTRGSTIRHLPVINGREVDLYLLYMMVTHHGGWVKVNSQGLWDSMLKQLGLPASCVNGGVAIRQLYLRHLERWERARGGGGGGSAGGAGGDGDAGGSEVDDERPRRAAWGTPKPRNTVAHTYNYNQHNVPDHVRESTGMPPLQKLGGAIERLALSLMSPLPNEQDFALNVCTILAADSANKLPVQSTPHIVDFLLGHAAVYNHPSLRDVVGKSYLEARSVKVEWFWAEHSRPTATLELLDEDRFPVHGLAMRAIVSELSLSSRIAQDGTMISPDEKDPLIFEEMASTILGDDEGILANRCPGGARDLVTRRISQIATIMRNLSFHEDNLSLLAKHQTFLRFILLCVNCSMSSIRQAGLDSFGNIAQEMTIKDPATCLLSRHVLSTLSTALQSDDRARILAALEILNKLAQNESNEDVLLRCLEQKVYEQVCSYLTLHDIMLLVVTLECVYALTSLGERSCDFIVKVHGVVDTLVSLITVEAQSYGPKACILMRVVETVPGGNNLPAPRPATPPPNLPPPLAPPPSLTPLAPTQNAVMQPQQQVQLPPLVQTVSQPVIIQNIAQPVQNVSQPIQIVTQNVQNVAQPVQAVVTTTAQQAATALSVQQQHAHQQAIQENEQFALAWLRTTWEPCPANIRLDSAELYKQYMACCTKVGRKGVIAPLHFPRCVRSVFGGVVGPNPIKLASGEVQQCYMGIRQRPSASKQTVIPQIKTGPASPILKAQLIKAEQIKAHPHLSQALDQSQSLAQPLQSNSPPPLLQTATSSGTAMASSPSPSSQPQTPNNTTLIKHLLAHKVSAAPDAADRMQHLQVTQRQNQQRMMGQSGPVTTSPISNTSAQPAVAMELDAEALISCSTITSTGVTSTSPLPPPNMKGSPVPPLAAISNPITTVMKEEMPDGTIIETNVIKNDANIMKNEDSTPYPANKMLADLLEKRSPPPLPSGQLLNQPEIVPTIVMKDDENMDEPMAKKARTGEGVSSTAANLYAAFAASALEDEEELVAPVQPPVVQPPAVHQAIIQPQMIVQQPQQNPQNQQMQAIEMQDQDNMRQVIMPSITNQGGQLILHGTPSKGIVSGNVSAQQFVSHSSPLQLIATQNNQGLGYLQGGVMPHKTIIILQSGNGNSPPITLTVNNSGALDESTLNNLISQASDVINQQQTLSNQSGNTVIQTNSGLIQTSTGVIQSTQAMMQPTQGMMHTTQAMIQTPQGMMHPSGIIKQQVIQGQAQLVASQQPVITQQPQSQIISTGHQMVAIPQQNQQMIVQGNQQQQFGQIITSNQQLIGGNQQIMVGNQQIVVGNQQIMMGNQIISSGGQQFISGNQQIVTMSQPFSNNNQTNNSQQRIISGNQFIVDQQGNRQLVSSGQNIVISNQMQNMKNDKKIVVGSSQLMQSQKIIVGNQQHVVGQQVITDGPQRMVQGTNKIITNQATIDSQKKLPPVAPHKVPDEPWVCQWRGCDTVFESAAAVYSHACTAHCTRPESPCLWAHCDQLPRKRFSLMTHLQDRHCSADALKTSLTQRRKGIIPVSATTVPPPPPPSATMERIDSPGPEGNVLGTSHPGYAPNAALHAIKRHAVDFLNPRELMQRAEASRSTVETPDDNEGPVTKSIRLTAALILRNICIYSHTGRRLVRGYEPHLAGIALSSVEASRTVAQVLYDMNCI